MQFHYVSYMYRCIISYFSIKELCIRHFVGSGEWFVYLMYDSTDWTKLEPCSVWLVKWNDFRTFDYRSEVKYPELLLEGSGELPPIY